MAQKNGGARVRELESRLAEARDQHTATSKILEVISHSPSEAQTVADMIAESAARLCDAIDVTIFELVSNVLRIVVHQGPIPSASVGQIRPLVRETPTGRAVLDRRTIHVADVQAETDEYPEGSARARRLGYRTILAAPLLHAGQAIGALVIRRTEVRPFTDRQVDLLHTFAHQAVIAIENVRLFKELERRNRDLATTLDRQTATADVLRIIAQSPTHLQPVLDAIAASAVRLCAASDAVIERLEGNRLYNAAHAGSQMQGLVGLPLPLTRQFPGGRAILDRRPIIIDDIQVVADSEYPDTLELLKLNTIHSVAEIPLLSEGKPLGSLAVLRSDVRPFTDAEIALLKTFADQAVIAIENVRLFKELEARNHALIESLDQQTATSEILRVISSSPTDTQPVFDAIAESAARLCSANDAQMLRVEGDVLRLVAACGVTSMPAVRQLTRGHLVGRAVIDRQTIHVRDLAQALAEYPDSTAARYGVQSALAVPLLHEGAALGVIRVSRTEIRPFTDKQIALLQTFADQAVIAIENVRLFAELQEKNGALTDALEQQTATSEILQTIAQAQTDVQPVFETIVRSAAQLCRAYTTAVFLTDGQVVHHPASHGDDPEALAAMKARFPRPLNRETAAGAAILTRSVVHVPDVEDPSAVEFARQTGRVVGFRSLLSVPMLRQGEAVGAINVTRREPGPFSDTEVALLQTFADQAVIALENVRLFTETKEALEQQTATSEILRVISQSPTDVQPVFNSIVESARRLLNGFSAIVTRLVGEELHLSAFTRTTEAGDALVKSAFPIPLARGSLPAQVVRGGAPSFVSDIETDERFDADRRHIARARGYRSIVHVPMLREGRAIGTIGVTRPNAGPFLPDEIALLQTFADQAVIAIENVRLFKELAAANRELAAASQHKSEFLANMSHELRTPLNAIIGFSEVLSEQMFGDLNEKQAEYLKDIHASGTHLLSLINDILDLSKIEAGRMELELSDFDLPTAIENALMLVRERAGRRSLALQTSIDNRLGVLHADERKVRQIVLNLLSNAIKFTPEGGRIEIAVAPRDGFVEISVGDTGIGIAPEDQAAVFEEFRQVGTAAKKVEGTGLGLALCRRFSELHGGRIWVKSELGAGSTFTFSLPLPRA